MSDDANVLTKFRISYDDLSEKAPVLEAYNAYIGARVGFGDARRTLNGAAKALHDLLDEPLRKEGLVPEYKHWSLSEDESDGLYITVWREQKSRGRKNSKPPLKSLSLVK